MLATHPEIRLRLVLGDRVTNMVEENSVRIGELSDSSVIAARVGSIRVVCASRADFDATGGRGCRKSSAAMTA